jgi:hypothetical protein
MMEPRITTGLKVRSVTVKISVLMMLKMQGPQTRTMMHRTSPLLRYLRTIHHMRRSKLRPVKMHMIRGISTETSKTSDKIKTPPWSPLSAATTHLGG